MRPGWEAVAVFSSGEGIIYLLNDKKQILWYRNTGYREGTFDWAYPEGKVVGVGWSVKQLLSGADLRP